MIKKYQISLDAKPQNRWDHVIDDNIDKLQGITKKLNQEIYQTVGFMLYYFVFPIIFNLARIKCYLFNKEYYNEMVGISKKSGIPIITLIQLNYGYDFLARCTSAIIHDKENTKMYHLRTMDWDTDVLKDLTIHIVFTKNGIPVYECVTWIGFVGIMTGWTQTENYMCTMTLNFRKEGYTGIRNLWRFLLCPSTKPVSFLIREDLEMIDEIAPFKQVIAFSFSPCYITRTFIDYQNKNYEYGVHALGKNRKSYTRQCRINDIGNVNNIIEGKEKEDEKLETETLLKECDYVIQTNHDHNYKKINLGWAAGDPLLLNSLDRKLVFKKKMQQAKPLTVDKCFDIMNTIPIKNQFTVYTTVVAIDIIRKTMETIIQV